MIITIGRKPFKGAVIDNVTKNHCGGINIKDTRLKTQAKSFLDRGREANGTSYNWANTERKEIFYDGGCGRFPANVILSHTEGCEETGLCVEACPIRLIDRQSGVSISTGGRIGNKDGGSIYGGGKGLHGLYEKGESGFGDVGGASRYFKKI